MKSPLMAAIKLVACKDGLTKQAERKFRPLITITPGRKIGFSRRRTKDNHKNMEVKK